MRILSCLILKKNLKYIQIHHKKVHLYTMTQNFTTLLPFEKFAKINSHQKYWWIINLYLSIRFKPLDLFWTIAFDILLLHNPQEFTFTIWYAIYLYRRYHLKKYKFCSLLRHELRFLFLIQKIIKQLLYSEKT